MSEDNTLNLSADDKLNLILAELGSVKREISTLNERVAALESRSYDTRPNLERLLAEILALRTEMNELRMEMRSFVRK